MTWFRTDDNFPDHVKMDALEVAAGSWEIFSAACTVWHHMGCDCARRRTDGVFVRARAHRAVRIPDAIIDRALVALVTAGFLLTPATDTFQYHDWSDYQPLREELEAEKRANTERQKAWREKQRLARQPKACHSVTDGVTNEATHAVTSGVCHETPSRPVPSVPDPRPNQKEEAREPSYEGSSAGSPTHANATDSSPAVNPPSPIPSHAHGAQPMQSTLPFDADAPTPATDAPAAPADASEHHAVAKPAKGTRKTPAKGSAEKTEKAVKAKRPKKELDDGPMPFKVEEALAALAATARGKFVVGSDKFWHPYARRNITANIRRFPDIATWSIVGEYLAATHTGKAWTPNWAASGLLGSEVILAMAWHDEGRPTNTNGRYAPPAAAKPSLHVVESETYVDPDRDPSITNENFDVNRRVADPFTTGKHANARRA